MHPTEPPAKLSSGALDNAPPTASHEPPPAPVLDESAQVEPPATAASPAPASASASTTSPPELAPEVLPPPGPIADLPTTPPRAFPAGEAPSSVPSGLIPPTEETPDEFEHGAYVYGPTLDALLRAFTAPFHLSVLPCEDFALHVATMQYGTAHNGDDFITTPRMLDNRPSFTEAHHAHLTSPRLLLMPIPLHDHWACAIFDGPQRSLVFIDSAPTYRPKLRRQAIIDCGSWAAAYTATPWNVTVQTRTQILNGCAFAVLEVAAWLATGVPLTHLPPTPFLPRHLFRDFTPEAIPDVMAFTRMVVDSTLVINDVFRDDDIHMESTSLYETVRRRHRTPQRTAAPTSTSRRRSPPIVVASQSPTSRSRHSRRTTTGPPPPPTPASDARPRSRAKTTDRGSLLSSGIEHQPGPVPFDPGPTRPRRRTNLTSSEIEAHLPRSRTTTTDRGSLLSSGIEAHPGPSPSTPASADVPPDATPVHIADAVTTPTPCDPRQAPNTPSSPLLPRAPVPPWVGVDLVQPPPQRYLSVAAPSLPESQRQRCGACHAHLFDDDWWYVCPGCRTLLCLTCKHIHRCIDQRIPLAPSYTPPPKRSHSAPPMAPPRSISVGARGRPFGSGARGRGRGGAHHLPPPALPAAASSPAPTLTPPLGPSSPPIHRPLPRAEVRRLASTFSLGCRLRVSWFNVSRPNVLETDHATAVQLLPNPSHPTWMLDYSVYGHRPFPPPPYLRIIDVSPISTEAPPANLAAPAAVTGTFRDLPIEQHSAFRRHAGQIIRGYATSDITTKATTISRVLSYPAQYLRRISGKGSRTFLQRQLSTVIPVPPPSLSHLPPPRDQGPAPLDADATLQGDSRAWRRALALATRHGGNASRILAREENAPLPSTAIERLRALFPRSDHPAASRCPIPTLDVPPIVVEAPALLDILQASCRGKAPGRSGWTTELLYILATDATLMPDLRALIEDILNGRVHPCVVELLRAGRGIALSKPDGAVRPIVIIETLVATAERYLFAVLKPDLATILDPNQMGIAYPNGADRIAHEARAALAADCHVLAFDMVNAYNAPERPHTVEALYAHPALHKALPLYNLLYGGAGPSITFRVHGEDVEITSERGVLQGSVLSGLLFVLSVDLRALARQFPTVVIRLYIDDVTMWSNDVEALRQCTSELRKILADRGISLHPTKSHHVCATPERAASEAIDGCPATPITKILGAWLGDTTLIPPHLRSLVEHKHATLWRRLRNGPAYAVLCILSKCAIPRISYLMRVQTPDELRPALDAFASSIEEVLVHLLQRPITSLARRIAHLPVRFGGIGVPDLTIVREIPYESSRAQAAWDRRGIAPTPQRTRMILHYTALSRELGADPFLRRLLAHNGAPHSSPWLFAADVRQHTGWFANRLCLRLGLAPNGTPEICACPCTAIADALPAAFHRESCPARPTFNATDVHNALCTAVIASANAAGVRAVSIDAHHAAFAVGGRHPDFRITLDGAEWVFDLTIAHPLLTSQLPLSEEHIIAAKELAKRTAYTTLCESMGYAFQPLVVFSTGKPTPAMLSLAKALSEASPAFPAEFFLRRWSIALAQACGRSLAGIATCVARHGTS